MARAITETAKAEKANLILKSAYELYKKGTFKSIKMIDIARASGVSKGTLFNYFSTKEKLFLEILRREQEKRFMTIREIFSSSDELDHDTFKKIILDEMADMLIEDSVQIRLTAILHLILEENIDYESALDYKKRLYEVAHDIAEKIAEKVGYLSVQDCFEVFMTQHAIIVGYRNLANVPDVITQVIDEHELDAFRVDFKTSALKTMAMYLDGLYQEKSKT